MRPSVFQFSCCSKCESDIALLTPVVYCMVKCEAATVTGTTNVQS